MIKQAFIDRKCKATFMVPDKDLLCRMSIIRYGNVAFPCRIVFLFFYTSCQI